MTTKSSPFHIVSDSLNLALESMTSDDKDELIGKLFNEVARLQRVLDALMMERDQLAEALQVDSRQTDSRDSQGKSHEQPHDSLDQFPLEFEETLVSDNTLRRRSGSGSESDNSDTFAPTSDSDSSSVLFPRQCGTPLSAPPNIFSFPDDGDEVVFLSSKRERRLSLPTDFDETEEYYYSYSVNDEDEPQSESCFEIVGDARYEDYVERVEEFAEEEALWDDDSEEEVDMRWLVSNRTHFLNNVQFEMPATRTGMEKYSRRIFHPCLSDIPETGECLITFPVPGLDFVDAESVIEEIPRCTSSLGFSSSASTEKKSWFDMTLEDEEDPFW